MKRIYTAKDVNTYIDNIYIEKEVRVPLKNSFDEMDKRRKEFIANKKLKEKTK